MKLSNKQKAYWQNYLGYWLVFTLATLIFSKLDHYDGGPPMSLDLKTGIIITSICASFILAHYIARKHSKSVELDELRVKEGLGYEEFNKKYGKVIEILNI